MDSSCGAVAGGRAAPIAEVAVGLPRDVEDLGMRKCRPSAHERAPPAAFPRLRCGALISAPPARSRGPRPSPRRRRISRRARSALASICDRPAPVARPLADRQQIPPSQLAVQPRGPPTSVLPSGGAIRTAGARRERCRYRHGSVDDVPADARKNPLELPQDLVCQCRLRGQGARRGASRRAVDLHVDPTASRRWIVVEIDLEHTRIEGPGLS